MVWAKISSEQHRSEDECDFKFLYTWKNWKQTVQDLSYDFDKTMEAISTVRSICIEAMYTHQKQIIEIEYIFIYNIKSF